MSQRVISFHYTLTDPSGQTIDSSVGQEPMVYMEGAQQIIPGLENQIRLLQVKEKKKINVPAAEAYGNREESFVIQVPLEKMPKDIQLGQQFQVNADPQSPPFTAVEMTETHVILDGNHPLAGLDLTFDVEIIDMREATAEELQHGHAHGPGDHHH